MTEPLIGIESVHGFGDCCFNINLVKALSAKYERRVAVAVRPHCADAFENIDCIAEIIRIPQLHHGNRVFEQRGIRPCFQITQNLKFFEFKQADDNHSLIDTPLLTGRQLGLADFDQRPVFIPTAKELLRANNYLAQPQFLNAKVVVGMETVYKSAQSWADNKAWGQIMDSRLGKEATYIWLSDADPPPRPRVHKPPLTRREVICCLRGCEIMFSVGSGLFCAALALPPNWQPNRIICLWTDSLYRYESRLAHFKWHRNITWVHSHEELDYWLSQL